MNIALRTVFPSLTLVLTSLTYAAAKDPHDLERSRQRGAAKAAADVEGGRPKTEHTTWLAESLREIRSIQPGMTRADLLKVFQQEEGGLSTRTQRRYVYRGCPFIKVDVTFEAVGAPQDKAAESRQDRIATISKPFLEGPIVDALGRSLEGRRCPERDSGEAAAHQNDDQFEDEATPEIDRLNEKGFSKLHYAAIAGKAETARQLLEQGADPNVRQGTYRGTPLQYAAARGHIEVVRLLLKQDADVDAADTQERTPLTWAKTEGQTEVVQELLKAGADPARIAHLNGPLTLKLDTRELSLRSRQPELYAEIGTPGPDEGTFVALSYRSVPADAHPIAELEFPTAKGTTVREKVVFDQRCWGTQFHGPVRVPEEAVAGIVKVTLSFPDWKDREIAPLNTEFRLVGTRAHHGRSRAPEVDASAKGPDALERARQCGAAKAATEHTAWLAESLREMQSIKPGMTRADLLEVFQEEGGLSTPIHRTYVYRGCPYVKVDVTFEVLVGLGGKLMESPQDKITRISKPFLEPSIID